MFRPASAAMASSVLVGAARSLHCSRLACFPKTTIGAGGRPGPDDPVQDLKKGAAKVKEAVQGSSDAQAEVIQTAKEAAKWTAQAAQATVFEVKGNMANLKDKAKEEIKSMAGQGGNEGHERTAAGGTSHGESFLSTQGNTPGAHKAGMPSPIVDSIADIGDLNAPNYKKNKPE